MNQQLDALDKIAQSTELEQHIGLLSTGERIYVALAANRADLLTDNIGYSLHRLGFEWREALICRHMHD